MKLRKYAYGIAAAAICSMLYGCSKSPDSYTAVGLKGSTADQTVFSITADNYVSVASSIYTQNLLDIVGFKAGPEAAMFSLKYLDAQETRTDCSRKGYDVVNVKHGTRSDLIGVGDSYSDSPAQCGDNQNTKDGYYSVEILGVVGDYHSGSSYSIRLEFLEDMLVSGDTDEDNNGRTTAQYEYLLAADDSGDASYSSIGVALLRSEGQELTNEMFKPFSDAVMAAPYNIPANFSYTALSYPEFAFEQITDNSEDDTVVTTRWHIRSDYTDSPYVNHLSATLTDFSVKKVGAESFAQGSWKLVFDSGEYIGIDCSYSDGCNVTLDSDADGVFEYQEKMDYSSFVQYFITSGGPLF